MVVKFTREFKYSLVSRVCLDRLFEWHKVFKEGRQSVNNEQPRSETAVNDAKIVWVNELILNNRRISVNHLISALEH